MKSFLWGYIQHAVDEFPQDCVNTLIRWFTGDRAGLTVFNVAECALVLAAYLAHLINKGQSPSADGGDGGLVVFGAGPVSGEVVPASQNATWILELADAVGAPVASFEARGLLGDALAAFVIKQVLAAILDHLKDQEFLKELVEEIRKFFGL